MTSEQAELIIQKLDIIIPFLNSYYRIIKGGAYCLLILFCFYLAIKFYKIFIKSALNRYIKFYI